MSKIQKIILSSLLTIGFISLAWTASAVLAQTTDGLDLGTSYASSTGLTAKDPRLVVANIIRIVLGFVGTIGVILVIYAGFLWMTAAGSEEKITKAKMILKNSVIGLALVLSAFAITSFVINNILEATNSGQNGSGGTTDPNLPPGPIAARVLRIESAIPPAYSEGLPRNTQIRFRFNYPVLTETINEELIKVDSDQGIVSGRWQVNGREIYFEPERQCDSECGKVNCLPENSKVKITLSPNIKPVDGSIKPLDCSGESCELIFITGDGFDCQDPVIVNFIKGGGVCVGAAGAMKASATDDYRLASFEFFANNESVSYQSSADYGKEWSTDTSWPVTGQVGDSYNLKVRVLDVVGRDQEKTLSGKVLPAHCCNGAKDEDETGIDCGGSCLRCQGAACANDLSSPSVSCNGDLCGSGYCTQQGSTVAACQAAGYPAGVSSCCLCQEHPVITGLSPRGGFCQNEPDRFCNTAEDCAEGDSCDQVTPNAKVGNLVTILGNNFGTTTGRVVFANGQTGDLTTCGINSWSDQQIIARVPAGVVSGKVAVFNASSTIAVSSERLVINNITRPGLCSLSKASGTVNELISYNGLNFIASGATTTKVLYGNFYNPIPANEQQTVSEILVKGKVPSLQNGQVSTFVRQEAGGKGGPASNFLMFSKVVDPATLPKITDFSPKQGPIGQYVTIYGQGFGNVRGQSRVIFRVDNEADYNFPEECATSVWSDNQIVVKVPHGTMEGMSALKIILADGSRLNAPEPFHINFDSLTPSICKISPTIARPGTPIQVWGEYFRAYDNSLSRFKFSQNINATTTNWFYNNSNGYSSATSTLPTSTVSGPVQIINGTGASNGLNLQVGSCQADGDCQGQICCPASSPSGGQCKDSPAACYGSSPSCTYGWSFTTTDSSGNCPDNRPICGGDCCEDDEECEGNNCVKREFLSCNNYHQCNGAMYCPNSPGWCSQSASSTIAGNCSNTSCGELFQRKGITVSAPVYNLAKNICYENNGNCSLPKIVSSSEGFFQVEHQLTCQKVAGNDVWTTPLVAGRCPGDTTEYGHWELNSNNICVSNKPCSVCVTGLSCLDLGDGNGKCALPDKICPTGSNCEGGQCKKGEGVGSCECCCDINLNNGNGNNPGCCAPLTCAGTCGAGTSSDGKALGYCSGCKSAGANQVDHDNACNCSGSTGKYCDTTVGDGICRDCSQITDIAQCASSAACCYDAKNSKCRGTGTGVKIVGGSDNGYCGYYSCSGLSCASELSKDGSYTTQAQCQQKCSVVSYQGQTCNLAGTSTGCGYQLCADPFGCRIDTGESATSTNQADCGTCCCDPGNDRCNTLSPGLTCLPNIGNCSGAGRGLCCGCSRDSQCGGTGSGCGTNTCCQARPKPRSVYPAVGSTDVCRNSEISIEFDQAMDVKTFNDNLLLIADYGTDSCPAGSKYLAQNPGRTDSWLAKLRQRVIAWFSPRSTLAAPVPGRNYCLIKTDITAVSGKKVKFNLKNVLDSNRSYYLALITDLDLTDDKREGALSFTGVGIDNSLPDSSGLVSGDNWSFNSLNIKRGFYGNFTTGNRICQVDSVTVSPNSFLLSDLQSSQELRAQASSIGANGVSTLLATTSDYAWAWNWSVGNSLVAELTNSVDATTYVKPKNNKDADTYVEATATVTVDNTGSNTVGRKVSGQSAVKVFLCANPWPARNNDGSWNPWADYATNMQLYYCRDGQDANTVASDLPGLKFVSSTDNVSIGSKAFYFFRYGSITAAPTNLTATAVTAGGAVNLSWNPYTSAVKYKIYYGLRSGQYFNQPIEVAPERNSQAISGLINGQNYYFAVSAVLKLDRDSFAETPLSAEVQKIPLDKQAPTRPGDLSCSTANNVLYLSWTRNTDDTAKYQIGYRSASVSGVGDISYVGQPSSGTTVKTQIKDVLNVRDIKVEVKAIDAAGNVSVLATADCSLPVAER